METVEGRGSGLGLPIVKALVEAHGGVFGLESELGKGTRAFAEFPPERVQEYNHAA
jgi:two-component system cell cycle sensor histidine kinase PleC